jgi:hypothetical protein
MTRLPEGYREVRRVDLLQNRREAILVNCIALAIMGVMTALGFLLCPPFSSLELSIEKFLNVVIMLLGIVVYMVLHEIVHGVFMKAFSGRKPHYGYTGFYAYAGSDALFRRRQYLVIAFSPVVILGAVIAVLIAAFYETAFWYLYIIQIVNLSGAAGDLYVGYLIARSGSDVMVRDTGTGMSFYSAQ